MSPPLKYWKLLLISPADGVACTVLMIPTDLLMGFIYLQYMLCFLSNIMELYLVQSIKKIKLQRLNNITDKAKNFFLSITFQDL